MNKWMEVRWTHYGFDLRGGVELKSSLQNVKPECICRPSIQNSFCTKKFTEENKKISVIFAFIFIEITDYFLASLATSTSARTFSSFASSGNPMPGARINPSEKISIILRQ